MISVPANAVRLATIALLLACPARAADELRPEKVADGVYAFVADTGEISAANRGHVGNSGFIVGPTGVVVIDTGVSYRHGRRMLTAIGRVTPSRSNWSWSRTLCRNSCSATPHSKNAALPSSRTAKLPR